MKKIFVFIACLSLLAGSGCRKFIDINQDPNNPEDVQESLILAPVEVAISQDINGGTAAFIIQMYLQNAGMAQEAPNTDSYLLQNTKLDGSWSGVYVMVLNNLKNLIAKAETSGKTNYVAIGKILSAFTLGTATDLWGDIPYTEALTGLEKLRPAYDSQENVYKTIQTLLDEGITGIEQNGTVKPGDDDFFYGGDMSKWKKLAYTLKARYYLHLTKAPGYSGETQAGLALQSLEQGMESNDDDLKLAASGAAGQESPWFLNFQPQYALVLASTFIDNLKNRNDPRLPVMAKPAENSGLYRGRVIGTDIEDPGNFSFPGEFYAGTGATNFLVSYSEALFIKAEATLITEGYAAAEPVYQEAVRSHMDKLGIAGAEVDDYLSSRGTLTAGNALQLIIEEKAVSNFLNFETFTDWRRTGFPELTIVANAVTDAIPRRLIYPESEKINNPQPQQSAKLTDKLWWDN